MAIYVARLSTNLEKQLLLYVAEDLGIKLARSMK
jgi:hypothetical protein